MSYQVIFFNYGLYALIMRIKIKLHDNQLIIPDDFLEKLALDEDAEVYLEYDNLTHSLIISTENSTFDPKKWVINATLNPPSPLSDDDSEDLIEYSYNDL